MNAVTITSSATPETVCRVEESRKGFIEALSSSYGAGRRYAADLVEFFFEAGFGAEWVTMAHDAKGPAGDAMRAERDTLYAGLKAAGHSNPSVKWKQIKGYAAEILAPKGKTAEGEGETAEGEGEGSAKHERSVQLRMVEDLTGLHKLCKRKAKELTDKQRAAHTAVCTALDALGIDINTL